jgi:hypothetical protein
VEARLDHLEQHGSRGAFNTGRNPAIHLILLPLPKTIIMKNLILLSLLIIATIFTSCNKERVKTYSAVIEHQSGTNAPTMDVFENDLGDIEWSYVSEGVYHGTRDRGFPIGETFTLLNNGSNAALSGDIRHYSEDFIELRTFAGGEFSNGAGNGLSFKIQVRETKKP